MIKKRNIAVSIILSIITCGIYAIYWFVVLTNEANAAANDTEATSGGKAFLFTLITCGIYGYYWAYKQGEKLDKATGENSSSSVIYLVLEIFGLGIVAYALMQDKLNKLANA